nr:MAG TPA: hypothetical protein [Caudoviricetes sp.]
MKKRVYRLHYFDQSKEKFFTPCSPIQIASASSSVA